jgi:hypothetical protein
MHGVLGHDGLDPAELRARGRTELARYGVEVVTLEVHDAAVLEGAVRVTCADRIEVARTVLLATGMLDELPDIAGFAAARRASTSDARLSIGPVTAELPPQAGRSRRDPPERCRWTRTTAKARIAVCPSMGDPRRGAINAGLWPRRY